MSLIEIFKSALQNPDFEECPKFLLHRYATLAHNLHSIERKYLEHKLPLSEFPIIRDYLDDWVKHGLKLLPPRVTNTRKISSITKMLTGVNKNIVNEFHSYLTEVIR